MAVLRIIAGVVLLILGRQLFWVFVAIVGFVIGMDLAKQFINSDDQLVVLLVGVFAGIIGAMLASLFYQAAMAIAGFLAGGRIGIEVISALAPQWMQANWIVFVIAGVIGAAVLLLVFDWALIVISSLLGASLIIPEVGTPSSAGAMPFVVLVIVGIVLQAGMMRRHSSMPPRT